MKIMTKSVKCIGRSLAVMAMISASMFESGIASAAAQLVIHHSGPLRDGEVVSISGVGFTPHDEVYLTECLVNDCNLEGTVPALITGSGALPSTRIKLIGIGPLGCGPKTVNECYILVSDAGRSDRASVAFKFG